MSKGVVCLIQSNQLISLSSSITRTAAFCILRSGGQRQDVNLCQPQTEVPSQLKSNLLSRISSDEPTFASYHITLPPLADRTGFMPTLFTITVTSVWSRARRIHPPSPAVVSRSRKACEATWSKQTLSPLNRSQRLRDSPRAPG
jgi:hypothetical protein